MRKRLQYPDFSSGCVIFAESPWTSAGLPTYFFPVPHFLVKRGGRDLRFVLPEKGSFILVQIIRRGHQITSRFSWQMCSIIAAPLVLSERGP